MQLNIMAVVAGLDRGILHWSAGEATMDLRLVVIRCDACSVGVQVHIVGKVQRMHWQSKRRIRCHCRAIRARVWPR